MLVLAKLAAASQNRVKLGATYFGNGVPNSLS